MLDIKLLRSNPEYLRDRLAIKGYALDVKEFLSLDNQRRLAQEETESLQNERNVKSKSIGQAKSKGEDVDGLIKEVGDLGDRLEKAKTTLATVREKFDLILHGIPNIPDESVPAGDNELIPILSFLKLIVSEVLRPILGDPEVLLSLNVDPKVKLTD